MRLHNRLCLRSVSQMAPAARMLTERVPGFSQSAWRRHSKDTGSRGGSEKPLGSCNIARFNYTDTYSETTQIRIGRRVISCDFAG